MIAILRPRRARRAPGESGPARTRTGMRWPSVAVIRTSTVRGREPRPTRCGNDGVGDLHAHRADVLRALDATRQPHREDVRSGARDVTRRDRDACVSEHATPDSELDSTSMTSDGSATLDRHVETQVGVRGDHRRRCPSRSGGDELDQDARHGRLAPVLRPDRQERQLEVPNDGNPPHRAPRTVAAGRARRRRAPGSHSGGSPSQPRNCGCGCCCPRRRARRSDAGRCW